MYVVLFGIGNEKGAQSVGKGGVGRGVEGRGGREGGGGENVCMRR